MATTSFVRTSRAWKTHTLVRSLCTAGAHTRLDPLFACGYSGSFVRVTAGETLTLTSCYVSARLALQKSYITSITVCVCVRACTFLLCRREVRRLLPYKVDGAEAAVAYFTQVGEKLLRVFFEEELGHLRVLQASRPHRGGHPAERSPLATHAEGLSGC